jgi:hypothetical protein
MNTKNITLILLAAVVIVLGVWQFMNKPSDLDTDVVSTETNVDIATDDELSRGDMPDMQADSSAETVATKTIANKAYSFRVPRSWTESTLETENGCQWVSVSNDTSDGLRMAGEIGVYPVSCFDINNANGYQENTIIEGFYILTFYDAESGTTAAEIAETIDVYNTIVSTFAAR